MSTYNRLKHPLYVTYHVTIPDFDTALFTPSVYDQSLATSWIHAHVRAHKGVRGARHTTVGVWRAGDTVKTSWESSSIAPRSSAPIYVPYFILEAEAGDLPLNHRQTRYITHTLDAMYPGLVYDVVFTGNESFHVRIPMGVVENPIFRNSYVASQCLKRVAEMLFYDLIPTGTRWDEGLWDPRHLVRLPGSEHEATGWRAVYVDIKRSLDRIVVSSKVSSSAQKPFVDPRSYFAHPEFCADFYDACKTLTRFYAPPYHRVADYYPTGSAKLAEALKGVAEGERNNAAFMVACHFLRQYSIPVARDYVVDWNTLNDPPLPLHEINRVFASAKRTINRPTR